MKSEDIILTDICGTLFRSNTTFDFLLYINNSKAFRLKIKCFRSLPWRLLNRICYRGFHYDLTRRLAIRTLKGKSKSELQEIADKFYGDYLIPRINHNVWQIIKESQKQIVLISGTIDIIAETVAKNIGARLTICSTLEYADGICTGHLLKDILDNKAQSIIEQGLISPFGAIITDNIGDKELIEKCRDAYIVVYENVEKWKKATSKIVNKSFIQIPKDLWYNR